MIMTMIVIMIITMLIVTIIIMIIIVSASKESLLPNIKCSEIYMIILPGDPSSVYE